MKSRSDEQEALIQKIRNGAAFVCFWEDDYEEGVTYNSEKFLQWVYTRLKMNQISEIGPEQTN